MRKLLLSVKAVSVRTMGIVDGLPELRYSDQFQRVRWSEAKRDVWDRDSGNEASGEC
jgi:hypothetical protein